MTCYIKKVCGMQWHLRKENEVVLSYRWQFQEGRSKGMGTEWAPKVLEARPTWRRGWGSGEGRVESEDPEEGEI